MLCPIAGAPGRLPDRLKRGRDDRGSFGIPPQPPGHVLLRGTPHHAHTRYRDHRTWQRTLCAAWQSRKEAPFAAARARPPAPDERVRTERAAWEDTRIVREYLQGTASPGRRRAFEIPKGRRTEPAQEPRHIPR